MRTRLFTLPELHALALALSQFVENASTDGETPEEILQDNPGLPEAARLLEEIELETIRRAEAG